MSNNEYRNLISIINLRFAKDYWLILPHHRIRIPDSAALLGLNFLNAVIKITANSSWNLYLLSPGGGAMLQAIISNK
jgi:hypothetical protein